MYNLLMTENKIREVYKSVLDIGTEILITQK